MTYPKVHILYENTDWLPPLIRELKKVGLEHENCFIQSGHFDLFDAPPEGIFINRMSPSSHTRGHIESVDFTREIINWLESYGRPIINGSRAFALEVSKILQYRELERAGIRTPRTLAVSGGKPALREAADEFPTPFITKHNRGGKGLGVNLFYSLDELNTYLESENFEYPTDHITLLQEYIEAPEPFITRVEIVNGQFQYAIKSDTSRGFLLCPADGCEVEEDEAIDPQSIFSLREGFNDPIVKRYIAFMKANRIDMAGIEFVEDKDGNKITYDVNTTTNYSPAVEERYGLNATAAVVKMIQQRLGHKSLARAKSLIKV